MSRSSRLSPAYSLAIFLSVPAGLLLALRYHSAFPTAATMAIAIGPAVVICLVAYLHTRLRSRE